MVSQRLYDDLTLGDNLYDHMDEGDMSDNNASKNVDLNQPFMVGEWLVEPAIERISKGELVEKVEPRVMDLLVCLARNPNEVITREELESKVWAGMVVGYDALTSAMIKLRKAFHEDSKHPQIIQTVSKRGYRLIVEVTSVNSGISTGLIDSPSFIEKINMRQLYVGLGIILFGLIYFNNSDIKFPSIQSDGAEIPSIIVLPFLNMSDDAEQSYFSDGITEDIITDLSRISKLHVMARNTSFRYKGQIVKPQEIGKELKVKYLLEGSVRKSGDKLRINAQLIETVNGYHVWSDRYDRKLVDVFVVQDEVTRHIVTALAIQLTDVEETAIKRVSTNNFAAYEHFLLGQKHIKERTQEAYIRAQDEFKEAIKLDPSYARSYGALAVVTIRTVTNGWTDSPSETRERALVLAKKAVVLDDTLPQAYWSLGFVHLYRNEFKAAAKAVEKATAIAPSYADGYGLLALINNRLGTVENANQAIRLIKKGMKLNPHYTWDYPYNLGRAYYNKGEYQRAIVPLQQALERNENALQPRLFLAASYSGLGMQDDAEWEIEQVLNINPIMSISHIKLTSRIEHQPSMKTYVLLLRKAGLAE
jgi:TolB-like protein/DNA-binding winged helix-turn-helix (wHTH) protein